MSAVSKPGFFRSDDTVACFCEASIDGRVSKAFTMLVINGSRVSTNSRTMKVGTGSSEHDFTVKDMTTRRTALVTEHRTSNTGQIRDSLKLVALQRFKFNVRCFAASFDVR